MAGLLSKCPHLKSCLITGDDQFRLHFHYYKESWLGSSLEILKRFPCTHYVFTQRSAEMLSFSVVSFTTLLLCSPQLDNTCFHLHPHEISSISPSQGDLGILPIMFFVTLSPWVCGLWHSYHLFTVTTF